jgi:DNA adenine methylase
MARALDRVRSEEITNVSSVPQRSPFRYPGGKTWLIPTVRKWLQQEPVELLIEPFAGGGIVGLTAAFENLAENVLMIEKDEEVAAVWEVMLNGKNKWLADKILNFDLTPDNVRKVLDKPNKKVHDVAFSTILKNRVFHGGILAKGSGMIKYGEKGKGIASRWYPQTLYDRITAISGVKAKIEFITGDGFDVLAQKINHKKAFFFIDPPYTIAGRRLYTHFDIDHELLFKQVAKLKGKFMLTYDDAQRFGFLLISIVFNIEPYR